MQSAAISTALCLLALDIEFLLQGRILTAMPYSYLNGVRQFALCPVHTFEPTIYRSSCMKQIDSLPNAQPEEAEIKGWANLELCKMYSSSEDLDRLSKLTVWSLEGLKALVNQRQRIFLAYLRVYSFSKPLKISKEQVGKNKLGKFIRLSDSIPIELQFPALSDQVFERRKKQLIRLADPEHPEIEDLYNLSLELVTEEACNFRKDVSTFLGWSNIASPEYDPDIEWIQQIANAGNSSDGYTFEKLVRKGLLKLGFSNSETNPKASLNPELTGGAGGIDVYCESPYSLVGECKASRHENVPNSVAAQLINLGVTHLGQSQFASSVKVIFAAGTLTGPANQAAVENHMNIIRPDTLERLVTLKAQHPGSIDLLQLKPCLETQPFGEDADAKVNKFINEVLGKIKLRSHLIQLIKNYQENVRAEDVSADIIFGAYAASPSDQFKTQREIHEILVELASPLAGYLGRRKDKDGNDRFYFLRDL